MWAIRRASNTIRNPRACIAVSNSNYTICSAPSNFKLKNEQGYHSKEHRHNECLHKKRPISLGVMHYGEALVWGRNLSSQVRANSNDNDDDLEDGFSELEMSSETDKTKEPLDEELASDSKTDGTEEDCNDAIKDTPGLSDNEGDYGKKELVRKNRGSPLFMVILNAIRSNFNNTLDKWVEEGNPLGRGEIALAMMNLRKRHMYGKALQFLEWLDSNKRIELTERDYASRVDLIAKVQGLRKAEVYVEEIPKSFRGEIVYRTLLANCVALANVKKSEQVFNKIRDLGFPITAFSCNQLLLLYKRMDRKKIGDVLKMMEKEDVKPSLFTYKLLVDTKGRMKDVDGMEDVIAAMKAEGMAPDWSMLALIVQHYIFAGFIEKAETTMKAIEGDDISKNRPACKTLLPLYAALGKTDDVGRIWKVCQHSPRLEECSAAIEAWGQLGNVEEAERVFENMMKSFKKLSSKYYNVLLKVYANHKLLSKGKELAKRMSDDGCKIGPLTWDNLVKLYVEAGDVEKANSILQKASEQNPAKPLYSTHLYLLEKYAEKGDIHKAEKMFNKLRQSGYVGRLRQYQLLLQAYVKAKTPAYGFRERLKADNVFPNKALLAQLNAVDAFGKSEISELLD